MKPFKLLAKMMHVDGQFILLLKLPLTLHAVFKDGNEAVGESKIAIDRKTIDRVFVRNQENNDEAKAARKVVSAIMEADMVVLGPGSFFTSILPNLSDTEDRRSNVQTQAETVYICNIMTQKGETEHFSDADHMRVLHKHLGKPFIDTVLVNTEKVPEGYMDPEIYDEYLVQVAHDFQGLRDEGCRVISTDFLGVERWRSFP